MKVRLRTLLFIAGIIVVMSCNNSRAEQVSKGAPDTTPQVAQPLPALDTLPQHQIQFTRGDRVPNEMVCMVNNAFMGKKQIPISFEGRTYYGCCGGCVQRTKTDESVRLAIDPQTGKKVDKANAYIVLIGDDGAVAYFASESSYRAFMRANNKPVL